MVQSTIYTVGGPVEVHSKYIYLYIFRVLMFVLTNLSADHTYECQKYCCRLTNSQQSVRRRYVLMRLIYTARHDKDLLLSEKKCSISVV